MITLALALISALSAEQLLTWERKQNTFHLQFDNQSSLELELVSPSTFRVRRGLPGPPRRPIIDATITADATGTNEGLRISTEDLIIRIASNSSLISATLPSGFALYTEAAAAIANGKSSLQLTVPPLEKFYGLGARPHQEMDARGLVLSPDVPFLITGSGYAFWTDTPAKHTFDLGKSQPTRLILSSDGLERIEYYIAFGPSLKEIWEERQKVTGTPDTPPTAQLETITGRYYPRHARPLPDFNLPPQALLCADAKALVHASLSGTLLPLLNLARYQNAPPDIRRRASKLGVFSPILQDTSITTITPEAQLLRKRLSFFLLTYTDEARTRGYPVIHPLLHQFPRDPEAGRHIDAFMFGDEFLIAPVCDNATSKSLYLPMGNWTDWNTNTQYPGRRTASVPVPPDGLIILVKSGSIIPLSPAEPIAPTELHYFPKNGGEFFIYEPEAADYTQAHAGPAADIYRVEIESKVDRVYEWVIHHLPKPKIVQQVDGPNYEEITTPGPVPANKWRYDSTRNQIHIGVATRAGSDIIVNLRY